MVHVELRYDFEIDIEALKTVLICFFEKAPVLHSSFTDNHVRPYWTVQDYKIDDVLTVKNVSAEELDGEIDAFLTQCIPPEAPLQMKVAVFRYEGKTVLCIVENHMCMDGGDFKYFMNALCKNYNIAHRQDQSYIILIYVFFGKYRALKYCIADIYKIFF